VCINLYMYIYTYIYIYIYIYIYMRMCVLQRGTECVAACVAVRVAGCRRVCPSVWYHLLQVVAVCIAVHIAALVAGF